MPTTKDYLIKKYQRNAIDEYLAKELKNAEYGGVELRRTPLGDRVILRVGRVGLAIGGRGRNIHRITEALRESYGLDNPQIEVTEVENPEIDARIMAFRLASSLERGRHFRRSAHGIIRRIIASGAKGVEIKISGKITSQRARVETFRAGFVAKAGDPADTYVDLGQAQALIRRGLLGVRVKIMRGDAILPDDISIEAEPTSTSMIVDTGAEEPEIIEEISEEVLEELEEYPDIEEELDEIAEEITKETKPKVKAKTKAEDELKELDEVDKAAKAKPKAKEKKAEKKEEKVTEEVKETKTKAAKTTKTTKASKEDKKEDKKEEAKETKSKAKAKAKEE
jgi:small subunit ribosomal protein S3